MMMTEHKVMTTKSDMNDIWVTIGDPGFDNRPRQGTHAAA